MKKGLVLIVVIFILSSVDMMAEEFNRGLGFTAGRISGVGFAYRQYFDKMGIQFTFGMLSDQDKIPNFPTSPSSYQLDENNSITKTGWEVDGSLSFMLLRTLRNTDSTRFYCFAGASIDIDYTKKYTQLYVSSDMSGSPVKKTNNNNRYYFGPGVGVDFQVSKYVSFIVELPIAISSDKKVETYIPQGGVIIRF